ncbi:hypothetical protein MQV46_004417 [Escherichia coli]|nr:hypothetical protein [Escherichia coli]
MIMGFVIFIAIVILSIYVLTKLFISENSHDKIRDEASRRIAQEEAERAKLYEERKESSDNPVNKQKRITTHEDHFYMDIHGGHKYICVDAKLVFEYANLKHNYFLHASHYFPELEYVYGKNEHGKIVRVDLYDKKIQAINPDTGEKIPGVRRYLRQHKIK